MMIIIVILITGIVVMLYLFCWVYKQDLKDWNNGYCKECNSPWKAFDVDSSGAVGFKCSCGRCIWISYWLWKHGKCRLKDRRG